MNEICQSGKHVTQIVTVNAVSRNIFIIPREKIQKKGELFQSHRLHSPNPTLSPFLVSMASIPSAALSSAEQDTGSKYLFMGQHRPS